MPAWAQDVNRHDADSLLIVLSRAITDTDRMNSLIKLAEFNIHQRRATDVQLNTAASYINQAQQLNAKVKSSAFSNYVLLTQSGLYKARGDTSAGKKMLVQVINKFKAGNNKALLGKAYYEMSEYYSDNFMNAAMLERIKYLQLAITAYQGTSRVVEMARCYRLMADLHQLINEDVKAFLEAKKALMYYKSVNYKETQGVHCLLGKLYFAQGDYKQALNYELIALKIATASTDDNVRLLCEINNNIGDTFFKLKEYQQAINYYYRSFEIAKREKDNGTIYLLASSVVDTYLKLDEPLKAQQFLNDLTRKVRRPTNRKYEAGDYGIGQMYLKLFLALKQFEKARFYCEQLISETKNPNINLHVLSNYYDLIGKYYIATAQYPEASYYLTKNEELLNKTKDFFGLARNYSLWFSYDTAQHRYKSAIFNVVRANKINDSLFTATKSRQVEQLQIEYETREKENQIVLLNQKAKLEQANLQQATMVKNLAAGGVALLLIIAGLLYRQNRSKQKNNIVITNKNELLERLLSEKEWLLKEVHHRVKNNLHTVICLLESQASFLENDALKAIQNSQNRIYAMSLIHQKLYQSENIKTIDLEVYIEEFVQYLVESFGTPPNIRMRLNIAPVKLEVAQAIPLGLIINEAVTNAFKYAFPDSRAGEILIELQQVDEQIKLVIADNGIGLFYEPNDIAVNSLGIELMKGLIGDITGTIFFESNKGTKITAIFKPDYLHASSVFTSAHFPGTLSYEN
jgi:two-component sensor histidine kinase